MSLPFTHPWLLTPFGAAALVTLGLALRAHLRPGLGVQVVGQRSLWQGLGLAMLMAGLGLGLAEPRWGLPEFPRLTVHAVLDASRSMQVPDAGAGRTRWEAAVAALDRIWSRPQPGMGEGEAHEPSIQAGRRLPRLKARSAARGRARRTAASRHQLARGRLSMGGSTGRRVLSN